MPPHKYSNKNLINHTPVGNNIRRLRTEKGWTQEYLAARITEEMNLPKEESLTLFSISAYEVGNRIPPLPNLIAIANIFGVSLDELVNKPGSSRTVSRKKDTLPSNQDAPRPEFDILLRPQEYRNYSGNPVYVKGSDGLFIEKWAILNYKESDDRIYLVFDDKQILLDKSFKLYRMKPLDAYGFSNNNLTLLNIMNVKDNDIVWVESISTDPLVKERYTGYYRNSEDYLNLINISNGLALPYTGIGISYQAYKCNNNAT